MSKKNMGKVFLKVLVLTLFVGVLGFFTAKSRGLFANTTNNTNSAITEIAKPVVEETNKNTAIAEKVVAKNKKGEKNVVGIENFDIGKVVLNIAKTSGLYAFFTEKQIEIDVRDSHGVSTKKIKLGSEKRFSKPDKDGKPVEMVKFADKHGTEYLMEASAYDKKAKTTFGWQKFVMILIALVLLYLGAVKEFEPLLLVPIAFGTLLVNVPFAGLGDEHGFLKLIFDMGIKNELFPLIIFMGVGALTDFGPLIANPKTALLGAAAQLGIFGTLVGAIALNWVPGIEFSLQQACAISIIGGADGPTSIYVASKLAPELMGSIAVSAYSYMALVPLIQPPFIKMFTTKKERLIKMDQLRHVSKAEKMIFPLIVVGLAALVLPSAVPLMGALCFGNFVKECGVVERMSKTLQNELLNIVTIFLGLGVGMQMSAAKFMQLSSLGILVLGLVAFVVGTVGGTLFGKLMNKLSKEPINPMIGAAGVSAVPMAARVVNKVGMDEDPSNFLLMHAMGPNVAGVIGSAIAAGVMIALFM